MKTMTNHRFLILTTILLFSCTNQSIEIISEVKDGTDGPATITAYTTLINYKDSIQLIKFSEKLIEKRGENLGVGFFNNYENTATVNQDHSLNIKNELQPFALYRFNKTSNSYKLIYTPYGKQLNNSSSN